MLRGRALSSSLQPLLVLAYWPRPPGVGKAVQLHTDWGQNTLTVMECLLHRQGGLSPECGGELHQT